MKLFYTKKQFQRAMVEKDEEIKKLDKVITNKEFRYLEQYDEECNKNIALEKELKELKKKYRQASSARGGLTKQINDLISKVELAEAKIEELGSDKYLVHKLPADKTKGNQKATYRIRGRTSGIIKGVKE